MAAERGIGVVGDGIIGLSVALELASRGANVTVFGDTQPGAATPASGGLLAPSVGASRLPGAAVAFHFASRDLFPGYLASLREGVSLSLGLLQTLADSTPAPSSPDSITLTKSDLARFEPALGHLPGALLHTKDGILDPVQLHQALKKTVESIDRVAMVGRADAVHVGTEAIVVGAGKRYAFDRIVLAAGAWLSRLELPTQVGKFVRPLKGQMVALKGAPLSHAIMADHGYLIPRGDTTIAGSTSEEAGFDATTTPATIQELREKAAHLCPALRGAEVHSAWAGLRPATPDFLPILGADERAPKLVYACGHSRNGILLAPATAKVIADILESKKPSWDLSAFRASRFLA